MMIQLKKQKKGTGRVSKVQATKNRFNGYVETSKLIENSEIDFKALKSKSNSGKKLEKKFKCRFCNKGYSTFAKQKNHENSICPKNYALIKLDKKIDSIIEEYAD